MSKQTAVDWLYKTHFFNNGELKQSDFEQAKKMEREQIEQSFVDGVDSQLLSDAEQYYNKTYKGGEQ